MLKDYLVEEISKIKKYKSDNGYYDGKLIGLHKGKGWGFSTEFAEYRPYIEGEDIRFLDWKHYAFSDRKYIRIFQKDTNTNVHIFADISKSMEFYKGKNGLYLVAVITGLLSYLFYYIGDIPKIYWYNNVVVDTFNTKGTFSGIMELWDKMETTIFNGSTSLYSVILETIPFMKKETYCLIISDLYEEENNLKESIALLSAKKIKTIVFFLNDSKEIEMKKNDTVLLEGLEGGSLLVDSMEYKNHAKMLWQKRKEKIFNTLNTYNVIGVDINMNSSIGEIISYLFSGGFL